MYKKIYDDLLEAIEKGIYSPGSKLPSEKELMEQYNVSRITSKKALEMLADQNIIVRMPGKGSLYWKRMSRTERIFRRCHRPWNR